MMRRLAARVLAVASVLALVAGAGVGVVGCKQEEGEYCQVDRDCAEGLVCVQRTHLCQREGGEADDAGVIDAAIDANESIDARERDGGVDAAPDAPIDAAPDA